jgi:hypothetical protein
MLAPDGQPSRLPQAQYEVIRHGSILQDLGTERPLVPPRRFQQRGIGPKCALASIAHEVIEAQLFRQMAVGGSFDQEFARHVVDDLVLPALTHYRREP